MKLSVTVISCASFVRGAECGPRRSIGCAALWLLPVSNSRQHDDGAGRVSFPICALQAQRMATRANGDWAKVQGPYSERCSQGPRHSSKNGGFLRFIFLVAAVKHISQPYQWLEL